VGSGSGSKPVIGITTYLTMARWSYWELPAALIPASYVESVAQAGGVPLLVPPGEDGFAETLDSLDGLVFSGGSDLDPELYGAEAHPETLGVIRERDDFELALMRAALDRDLPVLAICRGSQVLNVALGGDIEQHVPDRVGAETHKEVSGVFSDHDVEVSPGTLLQSIVGDRVPVKSHHHQSYEAVGDGLHVVARAEDGTPEALEDPNRRFALGVLWHPEEAEDKALFEALVREAAEYRASRPT
jgi:putative glutamine amidotransferase